MEESGGSGEDERQWREGSKARVFVSCGQRDDDERLRARQVRDAIRRRGFCPYLAFQIHSSKALTEGIYAHIRSADYFLFVDFQREEIGTSGEKRGSLFSNQELAIASYLEIESLYFVERGVKERDGIIGYIQGNPVEFSDREQLVTLVEKTVSEALWDPGQRHELRFERNPVQAHWAKLPVNPEETQWVRGRYYHMGLRNLSDRTLATGCIIQVSQIRNLASGSQTEPDPVEMKFKHVNFPIVSIPPKAVRQFDGMLVLEPTPSQAILGILSRTYIDSQDAVAQHTVVGPGDFEVDIVAYTREFSPARATMEIHLGNRIEDALLRLKATQTAETTARSDQPERGSPTTRKETRKNGES